MTDKKNIRIRNELRLRNVKLWQLADILGKSEPTIVRWLRHELPDEVQDEIISKIREYGEEDA